MRQSVTKDLFAYWLGLRGARSAPERSDIDPAAIRHVLADTFIIEIDRACAFPIRLCGTRLNALWLQDRKGDSFLDLWREADRRQVAAAMLTVIDGVSPVVAGARAHAGGGTQPLDLEMLLLPLRHFGKTHSRLLGSFAHAYQPDWLGRVSAQPLELISLRVVRGGTGEGPVLPAPKVFVSGQGVASHPKFVVYEGGKI